MGDHEYLIQGFDKRVLRRVCNECEDQEADGHILCRLLLSILSWE